MVPAASARGSGSVAAALRRAPHPRHQSPRLPVRVICARRRRRRRAQRMALNGWSDDIWSWRLLAASRAAAPAMPYAAVHAEPRRVPFAAAAAAASSAQLMQSLTLYHHRALRPRPAPPRRRPRWCQRRRGHRPGRERRAPRAGGGGSGGQRLDE
jgi:hypothetical protein